MRGLPRILNGVLQSLRLWVCRYCSRTCFVTILLCHCKSLGVQPQMSELLQWRGWDGQTGKGSGLLPVFPTLMTSEKNVEEPSVWVQLEQVLTREANWKLQESESSGTPWSWLWDQGRGRHQTIFHAFELKELEVHWNSAFSQQVGFVWACKLLLHHLFYGKYPLAFSHLPK